MNKVVKILLIVFGVLVLIGLIIYVKLFELGNYNYQNITINKVTVSESEIVIDGEYLDSSSAYKSHAYTLVGNELYVKVKNVLVTKKNSSGSFKIKIPINGTNVDNIHLTDDKTTKVIYSK